MFLNSNQNCISADSIPNQEINLMYEWLWVNGLLRVKFDNNN